MSVKRAVRRPERASSVVLRGDALRLPLAENSVDLIVTSPPYFGLRSYQDGGEHYDGQIGDELKPQQYVDALWQATTEMMRVLKPTGSLWVNLGDKYSRGSSGRGQADQFRDGDEVTYDDPRYVNDTRPENSGVAGKSLMGIPWRYALGCMDSLGLILRAEVIWSKPNGLPESVADRVRRSHEQWFHFVQQERYFSGVDEIREDAPYDKGRTWQERKAIGNRYSPDARHGSGGLAGNPLGKLPGSVWEVSTQPLIVPEGLGVDHFAAFPMEFPRRIILGWSPAGVCTACGEGRVPIRESVGETQREVLKRVGGTLRHAEAGRQGLDFAGSHTAGRTHSITGYACACPEPTAPTKPAIVLDPFGGTGTTALVAKVWGRNGISLDMSHDYSRLARWRTTDEGQIASAMLVEKPPVPTTGQETLF